MVKMIQLPSVYMDGDIMVVRASALGSCVRALSAYGRYDEVIPLQRQELLNRTSKEGQLHEGSVIDHLISEGYDVSEAQGTVNLTVIRGRVEVRGHIDGSIPGEGVVEVKTMSKSRFDDYQRHGLGAFPKYQWQLAAYMYGWADRKVEAKFHTEEGPGWSQPALYVVKRRDDGLIDIKTIDYPPISFQDIRKKLVQVYQHRKAKTLPDCDITGNEQFWCPFPFLHEEEVVDMELPDETILALEELAQKYDEVREVEALGKIAGKEKSALGKEILELMDGRDRAEVAGFKIVRVKQVRETVDMALLKADMEPADLAKYQGANHIEYAKVTKRKDK